MIRRIFLALVAGILSLVVVSASTLQAYAATNTASPGSGNGLKISPVRTDLTLNPGATQTVDIIVQNVTSSTAILNVLINDFTASNDEKGDPAIILNPSTSAPSHGLKQFIAPVGNITLQPNEQQDVKVDINIPLNAAGGGYFGAVRFEPATNASGSNISLSASVASLILVKVSGNVIDKMSIASFDARKADKSHSVFFSNKSIDAVVRFKNSGNVQEEPFGKIILKKGNNIIASYEINNTDPRGNVLPDSIRKFTVSLGNKVGSFGKYTVEGNFGYGSNAQLLSGSTTFYVVPLSLVGAVLGALILILWAIFVLPRWIKAYNRRVLRRARRR